MRLHLELHRPDFPVADEQDPGRRVRLQTDGGQAERLWGHFRVRLRPTSNSTQHPIILHHEDSPFCRIMAQLVSGTQTLKSSGVTARYSCRVLLWQVAPRCRELAS